MYNLLHYRKYREKHRSGKGRSLAKGAFIIQQFVMVSTASTLKHFTETDSYGVW
jgi:hypothetical protein